MKILLTALSLLIAQAQAIEVSQPEVKITKEIKISSPDDFVMTLGKVDFWIDLSAEHDSLLELKIRRAELTLADGRKSSVFGYNQAGNVIVVSDKPVAHISVTGVNSKNISVIFYDADNKIVAPHKENIRVFDLNFKPLNFDYTPAQSPNSSMKLDVTILLDRSGSMGGYMPFVQDATKLFMRELPSFSQCLLITFGSLVEQLGNGFSPCSTSTILLAPPIMAEGATALFAALETGLRSGSSTGLPHLVIVVTDGVNTENGLSKEQLIALKKSTNAKVLVFWAGVHDPEHLKGLADFESVSTSNIRSDLDAFFSSIGVSISGIQTLTLL